MKSLNDPEAVQKEYADEKRYAARMAKQQTATGPDPYDVVFAAVAEGEPRYVLEVGCGRRELAERMLRELSARVVALDQSARMVELTAARGIEAVVGDVVSLPFDDRTFDCVVAAWMLYHAADLDQALAELRRVLRPDGRLVTATSSERNSRKCGSLSARSALQVATSPWKVPRLLCVGISTELSSVMSSEPSRSTTARRPISISLPRRRTRWPISCQTSIGRLWRPGSSPYSFALRESPRPHRPRSLRRSSRKPLAPSQAQCPSNVVERTRSPQALVVRWNRVRDSTPSISAVPPTTPCRARSSMMSSV